MFRRTSDSVIEGLVESSQNICIFWFCTLATLSGVMVIWDTLSLYSATVEPKLLAPFSSFTRALLQLKLNKNKI
jgi:hypothetical protein